MVPEKAPLQNVLYQSPSFIVMGNLSSDGFLGQYTLICFPRIVLHNPFARGVHQFDNRVRGRYEDLEIKCFTVLNE